MGGEFSKPWRTSKHACSSSAFWCYPTELDILDVDPTILTRLDPNQKANGGGGGAKGGKGSTFYDGEFDEGEDDAENAGLLGAKAAGGGKMNALAGMVRQSKRNAKGGGGKTVDNGAASPAQARGARRTGDAEGLGDRVEATATASAEDAHGEVWSRESHPTKEMGRRASVEVAHAGALMMDEQLESQQRDAAAAATQAAEAAAEAEAAAKAAKKSAERTRKKSEAKLKKQAAKEAAAAQREIDQQHAQHQDQVRRMWCAGGRL